MKEDFFNKLDCEFNKQKITLSEKQKQKFYDYYNLLTEWNKKFNLTAITKKEEVIKKHFVDSVLPFKLFLKGAKIIDIGAGAGFPGIPLKILRPDLTVFLIDSVNKKVLFLNEVIKVLALEKVSTLHSRAEELAKNPLFRENFDFCIARAVAPLNTLCEYCIPFLKINGKMIGYKALDIKEEVLNAKKAISLLGSEIEEVKKFVFNEFERNIIIIKKIKKTPEAYPRTLNKPRLNPL